MMVHLASPVESEVLIPVDHMMLTADLTVPEGATGLVVFAHGSGSSRLSPRNRFVAGELVSGSVATLLVDLLSENEDIDFRNRFDVELLTERLLAITDWATHDPRTYDLPIGYFGASTGAAAAIKAAVAASGDTVRALVCRGGRVDMAQNVVEYLEIPTLLIVGQNDYGVRESNEDVYDRIRSAKQLSVIPGATHLFEEPGALENVAELARGWFQEYL